MMGTGRVGVRPKESDPYNSSADKSDIYRRQPSGWMAVE